MLAWAMTNRELEAALEVLVSGASSLGLRIDAAELERFRRYFVLLDRWSRALRLTGQRDPMAWAETHFLDSLTPLLVLEEPGTLLDAGSGAGFPGLPLAIVRPSWSITLLEAHTKKAAFLRAVVAETGLSGVSVVHARAEDRPEPRFGAAISRAAWRLPEWVGIGSRWLCPGGDLVAMLGRDVPDEPALRAIGRAADLNLRRTRALELPGSRAARTLVVWCRADST
jgi:16S rRNA (guanine527-N7)-methyltransferase